LQVKHPNVVQVSLIIISLNSSTHLGRYTLTASNAAGAAAGSIALRLASLSSSSPTSSHPDVYDGDADVSAAAVQYPDSDYQQLTGIVCSELFLPFSILYQRLSSVL